MTSLHDTLVGRIKARAFANGSAVRSYMAKYEAANQSASVQAIMMKVSIQADQKRDNITVNMPT
jgi:hypothetical protein